MAVPTWSLLTSGSTNTNATSFSTASVTLTAGRLYTLCVTTDGVVASDRQTPQSVTHAAGVFVMHDSQSVDNFVTQSVWWLIPGQTVTGPVTISHTLTQDIESWALLEWTNHDTGTPLGVAAKATSGAGTTLSVNTVAATSAAPARLAIHSWVNDTVSTGATGTEAAGWTEVADLPQGDAGFAVSMEVQARSSDAATASVTWSAASSAHGSLVVEVRELTAPSAQSIIPGQPIMGGVYGRGLVLRPSTQAAQIPRSRAAQDVAYDSVFFAPATGGNVTLTPTKGALTLSGKTPSLASTLTPARGPLTVTGYAPSVSSLTVITLTPTKGALTLSGKTPSLTRSLAVGKGALIENGYAPGLARVLAPAKGSVLLTGYAPTLAGATTTTLTPTKGALTVTGYGASLARQLAPTKGALTITGRAPTLNTLVTTTLTPSKGALALTGRAPAIAYVLAFTPAKGALVTRGYAATLARTLTATRGQLRLTGRAPTVTVTLPGGSVFPTPDQVAKGVQYGPTGADYTGTKQAGSFMRRR